MYAVVQSALYHVTDNDDDDDDDDEVKLDPSALIQRLQAAADDDDDHVICLTADHVRINTSMRYSCFISLSLSLSPSLCSQEHDELKGQSCAITWSRGHRIQYHDRNTPNELQH